MTTTKKAKAAGVNGTEKAGKSQKEHKGLNDMMGEGAEAAEKVYKIGAEIAAENYEKMVAMAQESVEAAMNAGSAGFKDSDDLTDFSKDNVDAFVKSGAVFTEGLQALNKTFADLTRLSVEQGMIATQAFLGCKTLADVAQVNSQIIKKNYDQAIEESRKLADMSVKLTEDVVTPLNERYSAAVDKFTKGLAA